MRKKSWGFVLFVILIGAFIGSALGEVIAYVLPEGVVKDFFLKSVTPGLSPFTLNLILFTITFGFSLKINVIGVIGIFFAAYITKWIE